MLTIDARLGRRNSGASQISSRLVRKRSSHVDVDGYLALTWSLHGDNALLRQTSLQHRGDAKQLESERRQKIKPLVKGARRNSALNSDSKQESSTTTIQIHSSIYLPNGRVLYLQFYGLFVSSFGHAYTSFSFMAMISLCAFDTYKPRDHPIPSRHTKY